MSCCLPFFLRKPIDKKRVLWKGFQMSHQWRKGWHFICSRQPYGPQFNILELWEDVLDSRGALVSFVLCPSCFSGSPRSKSFFFHSICYAICLCYNIWHRRHVFQSQKKSAHILFLSSHAAVFFPVVTDSSSCSVILIFLILSFP